MHIFYRLLKTAVFIALLLFAIGNAPPAIMRYLPDQQWQAPLALVLFMFLGSGVLGGVTAIARQWREMLGIKQIMDRMGRNAVIVEPA